MAGMSFAPLSFLRGRQSIRTSNWHNNPALILDTGNRTFGLEFTYRDGAFYNYQKYPAHDNKLHPDQTLYHPPAHYHLFSDEHFYIASGAGTWYLWDKKVHLSKGDSIVIPPRTWHWFEGDASTQDPLVIHVKYDKGKAAMEERFFRNTLGYLADCHRDRSSPSVFQMMVFFLGMEMAPGIKMIRSERLNLVLNTLFMYVFGGLGLLMGYRFSYKEYYQPSKKTE
ncbi:hypothetical protein QQS21_006287 [Conoideocrella luteorostrata]|uniref:Cupin type-2 domain-containing protein n=1 Tax=Conoideocrella luteorostrata TaxID=1105319 RepID=A0AAJ0G0A2_9HYPO|nr:hypothetical protein QQS21_006287 [Conoideocrella luteorostrata]